MRRGRWGSWPAVWADQEVRFPAWSRKQPDLFKRAAAYIVYGSVCLWIPLAGVHAGLNQLPKNNATTASESRQSLAPSTVLAYRVVLSAMRNLIR